jgi:hypothetical protein
MLTARGFEVWILRRRAAAGSANRDQLQAMPGVFRRTTFIGLQVRVGLAHDTFVRPAQGSQGQRVGRRPGDDKENLAVGLKELAQKLRRPGGPGIVAVGFGMSPVGFSQSRESFGTDAGIGIAGQLARSMSVSGLVHSHEFS